MRKARGAFLLVEMNDGFGVAVRAKLVTRGFEPGAKLLIVVRLAVKYDPDAAVLVAHRLRAGGKIDDGEATVPQGDTRDRFSWSLQTEFIEIRSIGVGTAMAQTIGHALQ